MQRIERITQEATDKGGVLLSEMFDRISELIQTQLDRNNVILVNLRIAELVRNFEYQVKRNAQTAFDDMDAKIYVIEKEILQKNFAECSMDAALRILVKMHNIHWKWQDQFEANFQQSLNYSHRRFAELRNALLSSNGCNAMQLFERCGDSVVASFENYVQMQDQLSKDKETTLLRFVQQLENLTQTTNEC